VSYAITVAAPGGAGAAVRALWDKFGRLERAPSMAALAYPPHLTLAIYERIDEARLLDALRRVFGGHDPFTLRFIRCALFQSPKLVVWADPEPCDRLARVHAAIHELIDPSLCHPHYQPGHWVPHCTLATDIADAARDEAVARVKAPLAPFSVTFGSADCVRFPPVTVLERASLRCPPPNPGSARSSARRGRSRARGRDSSRTG
jgi:2'-5' RNA ligase